MAKPKKLPPHHILEKLIQYDPETGLLLWKPRPRSMFKDDRSKRVWNSRYAGKPAGTRTHSGHVALSIDGYKYWAHRIAYKLSYNTEPEIIDHIDGDPTNNRLSNLRSVDCRTNARNNGKSRRNSSGVIGVSWDADHRRWRAYITVDGQTRSLGQFLLFDDAVAAREQAERKFGFKNSSHRASNYSKRNPLVSPDIPTPTDPEAERN